MIVIAPRCTVGDESEAGPSPSARIDRASERSTRLGLVVGRRVGNAVERNRVKRRIRHALRELGGLPGHDVVVIGHREVVTAAWLELVGWLADGLGGDGRAKHQNGGQVEKNT